MNKLVALSVILLAISLSACTKNQQASTPAQAPAVAEQSTNPAAVTEQTENMAANAQTSEQSTAPMEQASVEQTNTPVVSGSQND